MSSTYATVIISAADIDAADTDLPGTFTAKLSQTGQAPVTHYVASGYFYDADLTKIVNTVTWPRQVLFGPVDAVLAESELKLVSE